MANLRASCKVLAVIAKLPDEGKTVVLIGTRKGTLDEKGDVGAESA
ncbi:MAG: hypothetical protein JRJ79_07115 [Deltaproteobacteria bacterium]|nr:hypothetical protein [Deltaproteobacteria bacterium]MBW1794983.1 hypothetical protein [Deltaproteobacteria bacterium]